ncbi:MAG: phage terminase large subunit [Alphaproteobacteria bacterium]|nr:phage terminase large subunit [Alphaproteobacteria bacterium]
MSISYEEYCCMIRQDLTSFIERSFYELNPQAKLIMGDYIECIATKLEDCRMGKIKRLIINLPPRHLKSHCVTVAFTAWLLGHDPSLHIISASYGQDLSEKMARDTRNLMNAEWYKNIFKTRISPDRQAVHDFMTTKLGTRMATSVGGVLTGRGADIIIIDDPLKPEDALSETKRKNVNEWYDNTLLSRLNNKKTGCIIIIMQRLHQNDLVGHVQENDTWEVLSLSSIAEESEEHQIVNIFGKRSFKRIVGDILHPERESLATLEAIRKSLGEYNFQSQYQQNPAPQGGAMVKTSWLKQYKSEEPPAKFDVILQSWDTANKVSELSDYSVCTTWGKKGNYFYLLNVFRRRMDYPELKRAVKDQATLYSATTILIEDKASGTQLIQELKYEGLRGVTAYEPSGSDKIMRLHAQTAAIENGQVLLPTEGHWLPEYIKELTSFPGCKYDDQVDSTAQALDWLQRRKPRGFFSIDVSTDYKAPATR